MAQGKQAKVLSPAQIRTTLQFLQTTRHPERDTVIFLLSCKSACRAKEVSNITWEMVTDPEGNVADAIQLQNIASKGKNGGRTIPLNKDLKAALVVLRALAESKRAERGFAFDLSSNVVTSERGARMSANSIDHWFKRLYANLGFSQCSSHSGRRTAITTWARNVSKVSGSLKDVQSLCGHSSLAMTQLYIDQNTDAQKSLVDLG